MMRILIADDDPTICELISDLLIRDGFEVHTVNEMADARQWLEQNEVDLLLSDYTIDEGDTVDFIKDTLRRYSDISIIVMSGYLDETLIEQLTKIGVSRCFVKPFSYGNLLETLRNIEAERREQ